MAGTERKVTITGAATSDVVVTREEYNKLVDDLETLRAAFSAVLAKLDLDAGVTDTNYASLHDVTAAELLAAKATGF